MNNSFQIKPNHLTSEDDSHTAYQLVGIISWLLVVFGLLIDGNGSRVYAATPAQTTLSREEVLCLPGVYSTAPQDCLLSGPAAYLTRMADLGITFPLTPPPTNSPEPDLAYTLFQYARLKANEPTPVYATAEQALKDQAPISTIEAGELRYVSYIDEAYLTGGTKPDAFELRSGGWIAARSVSHRENAITRFQGVEFNTLPIRPVAWVRPLNPFIETKRSAGSSVNDFTGHQLYEYTLVQVYAQETVDNVPWVLVGPDEWVEKRLLSIVYPNPSSPEGVSKDRWIEVNLEEQTLSVYDQHHLVFATMIASGTEPLFTRPGLFPIYKKYESTPMAGAFEADRSDYYLLQDVPWTMYYDKARALHGAYWRTRFGYPQSHGCVNLSPGDAHWIFNWALEGDWVYVWDPSGKTPTDPEYYGDGGA